MARTIDEIFLSIEAEKNSKPELVQLNSPSQYAKWRLWAYITAVAIWVLEKLWDEHTLELMSIVNNNVYGSLPWYQSKAKEFQWDNGIAYILDFNSQNIFQYTVINPAHRIVKYAAAVESFNGTLVIKAAKESGGVPVQLTSTELTAFSDYMQTIKVAGTPLQCISLPPDLLRISGNIYCDPVANQVAIYAAVESAIMNYLNNLPFNSLVYVEKVQDVIQKVTGVVSCEVTEILVNMGANTFFPVNRYYASIAGYVQIDSAAPLASTLIYIPSNV